MTLSTSYAFGDVFGIKHSLHRRFRDARQFYLSYTALVVLAAGIVLIPRAPLGLITTSVQALAGCCCPAPACSCYCCATTRKSSARGSTSAGSTSWPASIIGVLLTLSGTLVVSTVFPDLNVPAVAMVVALALIVAAGGAGFGWG